jgi:flavin-binding protein dodecin
MNPQDVSVPGPGRILMMVRKSINLAATGPTLEAAVQEAIDRATTTLEGVTRFEVTKIAGDLTDAGPVFDIELTVWFTLLERMH